MLKAVSTAPLFLERSTGFHNNIFAQFNFPVGKSS